MTYNPKVVIDFAHPCRITFDGTQPTNEIGHYIAWTLILKLDQAQKLKVHRITEAKKRKAKQ